MKKIIYAGELNKEFYKIKEISIITGLTPQKIYNYLSNGHFKNIKQIEYRQWLVSREDVSNLINELLYIENGYTVNDIKKIIGMSETNVHVYLIGKVFKNFKRFNGTVYVPKTDVEVYAEKLSKFKDNYYSITEVANKVKEFYISRSGIMHSIYDGKIHTVNALEGYGKPSDLYIAKPEIDAYCNTFKDCITIDKASKEYNLSPYLIKGRIKNGSILPLRSIFSSVLLVKKEDIEKLVSEKNIEEALNNCNTLNERIDLIFKEFSNEKLQHTIKLFINNTKQVINNSNEKEHNKILDINKYKQSLKYLLPIIKKEIYLHNDYEINNIFNSLSNIPIMHKKIISIFFKYCLKYERDKCNYRNVISVYNNSKKKNSPEQDIYSKEIWLKYHLYLMNIDKHIVNAFNNDLYANHWLYALLHLSLFWRRGDLVDIPVFSLPIKGIDNIEWFEKNTFDLSHAKQIINEVDFSVIDIKINKTKKRGIKVNFVIPTYLLIPTAIAFIACQKHSLILKRKTLLKQERYFSKEYFQSFFEDSELKDFSNRKANRTLSTYSFQTAVNTEGMAYIAYTLESSKRGHIINYNKTTSTDTTANYIITTNGDGSANDVSLNLFLRGYFGHLYHMIVQLAYGNIEDLKMPEVTKLIKNIGQKYSPKQIENISNFTLNPIYKSEIDTALKYLLKVDRNHLKEKINSIFRFELPSKFENVQCVIHPDCIYPKQSMNCFGCQFSLPTIYSLKELETRIFKLIDRYNLTKISEELERAKIKNFIKKYLIIINEAINEYEHYNNKDFIYYLIDIKKIQDRAYNIFLPASKQQERLR